MERYDNTTRSKELEKMTAAYTRLRNMAFLLIGILVLALALALLRRMEISLGILALVLLYRLFPLRAARNAFRQTMIDGTLRCSVGAKLDAFELKEKGGTGLTREDIQEAELLPIREGEESFIGLYQGISGPVRDLKVSLNDTTLQQYTQAGQKGADVSVGVWIHFLLPRNTGLNLRILSEGALSEELRTEYYASRKTLAKQDSHAVGLKGEVHLYTAASDSQLPASGSIVPASGSINPVSGSASAGTSGAGSVGLSAAAVSAVNDLFRKTTGAPALSLRGNILDLYLRGCVLGRNFPQSVKPDESTLNYDPLPEFREALILARSL